MASTGKLHGKVAFVSGGAGGIGSQVCLILAAHGASVAVVDLVSPDELLTKIAAGGGKAISVKADFTKSADITAAFDKVVEQFGALHIVVHLAATSLYACPTLQNTSEEDWDRIFSVNTRGTFLVAKEAANRLGPGGRIVLTSSSLAQTPMAGVGHYACTKAAVECMVKVLSMELAGREITVNGVAPGPTMTPLLLKTVTNELLGEFSKACPMGRVGKGSDIAPVIRFLVGDEAEWVNGQIIRVSGGL